MESFMELPVLEEWAHQMPFALLNSIATTVAATVATTEGAIVVIIAN